MTRQKQNWTAILPVPDDVETPVITHPKLGSPKRSWPYYDANGGLLGFACEFLDFDVIRKQPFVFLYCQNDKGERSWRWEKAFPHPAPLFNLDMLAQQEGAEVIIVQTEREADAVTRLFPEVVAVTWPAMEAAVNSTDWRPLKGRKVCVWPANHPKCIGIMNGVVLQVRPIAGEISILSPPEGAEANWCAIKATKEDNPRANVRVLSASDSNARPAAPPPSEANFPFKCLGYDHGSYFYKSDGQNQVIKLSAVAHAKSNLLTLAPLLWWESSFPGPKGCDWDAAVDLLLRTQERVGPYDHEKVRGRGVWTDNGKAVIHLGDHLRCEGKDYNIRDFGTSYIYESRPSLSEEHVEPLTTKEAYTYLSLCDRPTWKRKIYGRYFAGWCTIATICGGLEWRPSLWATGPSGSGKTWLNEHMLMPMLGKLRVYALGKSTEAGIRQMLQNDALPVIIEEAEQDDKRQDEHIQSILTLMRQASSETGAKIYRGTTTGQCLEYSIKSAFYFSSIGIGARHHADQSRITILELVTGKGAMAEKRFTQFAVDVAATITPEYAARFRSRAYKLLPVIRKNARVFSDAVTALLHSKRTGDQVGVLLAGAYSLCSENEVGMDVAMEWVRAQDWEEEREQDQAKDEVRCLQTLLQTPIRVQTENRSFDRHISELIAISKGDSQDPNIYPTTADEYLRQQGIRVIDDWVCFSNTSRSIHNALKETPWMNNYPRLLQRIQDAEPIERMRFTPGVSTRAVRIPIGVVMSEEPVAQEETHDNDTRTEG